MIRFCKHTVIYILHTKYSPVVKEHSAPFYRFLVTSKTNLNIPVIIIQIYLTKFYLNKANSFDTEAPLWDWDLDISITNGIVSSKIYDKQDDFNIEIVIFSFLASLSMMYTFHNLFIL